jgi:uncharacterized protein YjdB
MKRELSGLFILIMGLALSGCSNPVKSDPAPLLPSTIVFADGSAVVKQLGSGTYTNTVSGDGTGAVTYASGTPATATVDASTGAVTLVAAGSTVITAAKAATATYAAASNTYTLTVTLLIPSTIVFSDGAAVTRQIGSGAYTNAVSGVGDGAVTYGSGTPATATVDTNTGAITLVAAGTTIITASKAATATYAAVTNAYTLTVTKIPSTVIFADGAAVTKQIGSGAYTNAVSGVGDGAVTYTSGTPATATVNSSTGAVTLVAGGTTVITATRAASAMYAAATNTYTLTVTKIPSTIIFADGDAVTDGVGHADYTNPVSGAGTGTITYTSSNTTVATVNSSTGAVTLLARGTTVITANKAATATYAAVSNAYTLTVQGIGTYIGGGIIAYILKPGDPGYIAGVPHGLIAAIGDQSTGIVWALPAYKTTSVPAPGAVHQPIGTGLANTNAIVAQNGAGTTYAAGLCRAYTNSDTGTGVYSDWYLPSYDELRQIYYNRAEIGGFSPGTNYWSSSEYTNSQAWCEMVTGDYPEAYTKDSPYYVRAVRSF